MIFFWIPALLPLIGICGILVSKLWPISQSQGAHNDIEISRNWNKFGAYFVVNIAACAVIASLMWLGATAKTRFPEVWNFRILSIKHEMEWTTKQSRTRQVACGKDKDGNTKYRTETYYVTEHHGPYWTAYDEYGNDHSIDEKDYYRWRDKWANERRTGTNKGSAAGFAKKIDGPIFECSWPKTFETIFPWAEIHSYVNKIRVSQSVLNYGEPTKLQVKRFPRPADDKSSTPILNYSGLPVSSEELMLLRRVNASLGVSKEIHTILILFNKDESRSVVTDVLTAWQGPNKNELCTFISVDGQQVKWVEVHSWMDNTTIHAVLRDSLAGRTFTIQGYADLLLEHCHKLWQRKHFTPINAYLHVPIHPGWAIVAIFLSVGIGVGSYFAIDKR